MKLIISTDGTAPRVYTALHDDVEVPKVEDIRYGRTTGTLDGVHINRAYAHIEMDGVQALEVAMRLLFALKDEDVISGWRLSFPEREEPKADRCECGAPWDAEKGGYACAR